MNQSFEDINKKASREHLHKIWQAAKKGELDTLDDEEKLLAEIMSEHDDEFHNDFEFADVAHERDYDPDSEVNPFLHIIFHSIVENQLKEKDPIEVYQFYNAMLRKKMARHDIIHLIGRLVANFIFRMMHQKIEMDLVAYKSILKRCKNTNPGKVWDSIDREFSRMFPD